MRKLLLATTCLTIFAAPALAETKIETSVTGPVLTSTVKNGTPDDILITSAGKVTSNGTNAVVIDNNHTVKNQGTIQITNVNGAVGIDAAAGVTSGIDNSGTITVDESYTPVDSDNDGDLDGPFALGTGRYGIRTNGAFIGNISNSGTVSVEGNDSFGIYLGGPLTGNFTHNGTTKVLGTNTVAVHLSDVTGNVRLAGNISAQGQNAIAIHSTGDVTGAMVIQGKIVATGYRYTQPPADTSKLDADDLLQGGPAIWIEGDVSQGIILAIPPKDLSTTDNDEDHDGIEDSKEGSADVVSFGSAAALRIGSSSAINIGATQGTGTGFGLIIDGNVTGTGLYAGVDGNGLEIGGQGGSVSIANGIGITGTVQANSVDKKATAIRFGAGATTPELRNAGKIIATSGKTANSVATAVLVEAGANLPILRNSGSISATVGGTDGTAVAIVDKSGTLGLIENSGSIKASGAADGSGRNVAIDLGANTAGATVKQTVVASNFTAPSITGDVKFGSGNDIFDIADGTQAGDVSFGAGDNQYLLSGDAVGSGKLSFGGGADTLSTSGTSTFTGTVDFGGGADTLAIGGTSSFTAQLSNSAGLAVTVDKGNFGVVKAATISSLTVTNGGTLSLLLDKTAGAASSLTVGGTASFGDGSKLKLSIANVAQAEGTYAVLTAGTLVGGDKVSANTDMLPFLYNGTLTVSGNQLLVDVQRKTKAQLGLNKSESAAFDAIYTAIAKDSSIGNSFLAIRDQQGFVGTLRQMLPEHAGGSFDSLVSGDRAATRVLQDTAGPYDREDGKTNIWLSQVAWSTSKDVGDTAGYKASGGGITAGGETRTGLGDVGLSLNYLVNKDDDRATSNNVQVDQLSLTAHWRTQVAGFELLTRAGVGRVTFDGKRRFSSNATGTLVERTIDSSWHGRSVTASTQLSRQWWAGSLFIRPLAGVEYFRLNEDAYQESGGGDALDLSVGKRNSDEIAVNGLFTAGMVWGGQRADEGYFQLELEGGRRQVVGGSLGSTSAHFKDGETFTLDPEKRRSGWVARMRASGGNSGFRVGGELSAEQRQEKLGVSARASLILGM